ncbi:MAG: hypothetical protein AB1627_01050 [Chloroflexota bacterium]
MGDGFTMTVTGGRELRRAIARLEAATAGKLLLDAATAGALPVLNQAKVNVHKVTATLAKSLHIEPVRSSRDEAEVMVGTDVEYARREELGFMGRDSLGRRYSFAGHPYLRPAFDEKRDEARDEVGEALRDLLRKAARG